MWRNLNIRLITMIHGSFIMAHNLSAQTPTHYPTGQNRVDLTLTNILIYIVFPVLLLVIWILMRRRKSGQKGDK